MVYGKNILALALFLIYFNIAANAEVVPQPADAMSDPSKHAWDLFEMVNHPAKDPRIERGVPDMTKKIGDPGILLWETWKLARTEVFLKDGSTPPPWEDLSREETLTADGRTLKTFDIPKADVLRAIQKGADPQEAINVDRVSKILGVDVENGLPGGGGESRMNRATFKFIVDNELYNIEGQEKIYEEITAGTHAQLSFPSDSIEVKAMWLPLDKSDDPSRFHVSSGADGKTYKLVSLHLITKDVPKWFWATFRHMDDPQPLIPSVDTHHLPPELKGTKWQYYELSGTQTDFVDTEGQATYLSDPHIEAGFENSSCISCHALSSIGHRNSPTESSANRIAFFNTNGFLTGAPVGPPNPNWFFEAARFRSNEPPRQNYIQLDFLFSLSFRANRKVH